jgi:hypothetical protein
MRKSKCEYKGSSLSNSYNARNRLPSRHIDQTLSYIRPNAPKSTMSLLSLLLTFSPTILAQPSAQPLSFCQTWGSGGGWTDICCSSLTASTTGLGCVSATPVANITKCSVERDASGWSCCAEIVCALLTPGYPVFFYFQSVFLASVSRGLEGMRIKG